jgi:D-glycero-alpha-D-manno-heptose-7-phosphate kinase
MIVTKTPLRMSFLGGGSDIPQFYKKYGGICVSASINSYIYIAAHKCVAPHLKVIYSHLELENDIDQIKHDRVREVLKHYGQTTNMEIASFSNIPTKGTGLGSSSTFTVGLINAVSKIAEVELTKEQMAKLACHIEIEKCKEPIGKQDQYAAAIGGLNVYEFHKDEEVEITPLEQFTDHKQLQKNLLCFNTGVVRMASSVLKEQVDNLNLNINVDNTKRIVEMTRRSIELLKNNNLDEFGILMHEAWQVKKQLSSNISNQLIDNMYDTAIEAGALGGKILGAGGGGYLLVYVPENRQKSVLNAMRGYQMFEFEFEHEGSKVEMIS